MNVIEWSSNSLTSSRPQTSILTIMPWRLPYGRVGVKVHFKPEMSKLALSLLVDGFLEYFTADVNFFEV